MLEILSLVREIVAVVVEAIIAYDETPEGKANIDQLLSDVEAAGFDVPFWQPNPLDLSNDQTGAVGETVSKMAESFRAKHPELSKKEAQ